MVMESMKLPKAFTHGTTMFLISGIIAFLVLNLFSMIFLHKEGIVVIQEWNEARKEVVETSAVGIMVSDGVILFLLGISYAFSIWFYYPKENQI